MKRIFLFVIIAITIGIVVAAGAYVYELTISGNVVVIETPEGEYEIQAFEDASCTVPLTHVDWGEMRSGELKRTKFYVKNTGNETITSMTITVESPVQHVGGNIPDGNLAPNQSLEVTATLMISPTAEPGSYDADIKIVCTG